MRARFDSLLERAKDSFKCLLGNPHFSTSGALAESQKAPRGR